jgi:hypothetical protein
MPYFCAWGWVWDFDFFAGYLCKFKCKRSMRSPNSKSAWWGRGGFRITGFLPSKRKKPSKIKLVTILIHKVN